ncbi:MAG: flotillin [Calditrichaeota bacterium]|nr:MAG: flotillin [Calditrichota bacterium]
MISQFILVLVVIAAVAVFIIIMVISNLLLICHPNEVIILSGRERKLADGSKVGYRIIRGGKAVRIPLIEKAARMSLQTLPLELQVTNAYSKGGIPLSVEAIANVKINSKEPIFGNAVERFLDKSKEEILHIAKDTLEGNLRGVLAMLTPEEVNEDRLKFAGNLIEEADTDLQQLGLQLDTLKIQNISDDTGYLDSIGRKKTAEVISQARMAEAERTAEAEKTEAESKMHAEVARAKAREEIESTKIETDTIIKTRDALAKQRVEEEENNLRVKKAELEKIAIIREEEARVAGEKARAQFEQEMEQERIILQQKRLEADVVEPAKAEMKANELKAKGNAAHILEDGEAKIAVLKDMITTYQSANGEGEKVFILQMLPEIINQLSKTVGQMNIDKISVIDSGGGGENSGISKLVNQMPAAVISLVDQIETATGVNILKSLQAGQSKAEPSKETSSKQA